MCISEKRVPRLHRLQPEKNEIKWNKIFSLLGCYSRMLNRGSALSICLYILLLLLLALYPSERKKQQKQIVLPSIFIIIFMSTHLQTNKPPMLLGCFPHMGKDRMGVRARARTRSKDSKENTNQRQRKPAKCGALGQRCGGRSRQQSYRAWDLCCGHNVTATSSHSQW